MPLQNTRSRYGHVAQALHWGIAALILVQFVLANVAEAQEGLLAQIKWFARHKSFGMTILALAALRLGWRLYAPPPPLPGTMSGGSRSIARSTHWLFYGLLFALPVSGWTMSSAANFPVSWFGVFTFPDLVAPDEDLKETLEKVHELLARALWITVLIHVGAALKHHFLDRDDVLRRMLPWPRT